jgi:hypothetical protein
MPRAHAPMGPSNNFQIRQTNFWQTICSTCIEDVVPIWYLRKFGSKYLCLVCGPRYQVLYQASSTRCLVPGTWYLASGSRYLVPGAWYQAPGAWCQVSGTRCLVPSTWYQAPGLKHDMGVVGNRLACAGF